MAFIDTTIPQNAVSADERAVIESFGFELHQNGAEYRLVDPVVRKANRGKGGAYNGTVIDSLLKEAVRDRKVHDDEQISEIRSTLAAGKTYSGGGGAAAEFTVKPFPSDDPKPEDDGNETAKTDTAQPEQTSPAASNSPSDKQLDIEDAVQKAGGKKGAAKTPPTVIEDPTIDNTGKRERNRKERVQKQRKPNRYIRAARAIVENLDKLDGISLPRQEKKWRGAMKWMAGAADCTLAGAGHNIEAWLGITSVLVEKGWLKLPKSNKQKADSDA